MAQVSTYLNFQRNTEEAFNFYKTVFGSKFKGGISRFCDIHPSENHPLLPEEDKNLVMHIVLPIFGGHVLINLNPIPSPGILNSNPSLYLYF